jgi:hypothetical protein
VHGHASVRRSMGVFGHVRPHITGAIAVATIAAAALAAPAGTHTQGSPWAAVTGSGKVTFAGFPQPGMNTTEQFEVSAHDGPNGPSGTIVVHSPLYSVDPGIVDVSCIVVDGNQARVGGKFREPFDFLGSRISHFGIIIMDNGPPGVSPDEIHPVEFLDRTRPPEFTPCNMPPLSLFALDSGNYVVRPGAG